MRNSRTVKTNLLSPHPPPRHYLEALCFSSLCDYLFICLLIYVSLPRVHRACVPCALLMEKEAGGCCIQIGGGEASAGSHLIHPPRQQKLQKRRKARALMNTPKWPVWAAAKGGRVWHTFHRFCWNYGIWKIPRTTGDIRHVEVVILAKLPQTTNQPPTNLTGFQKSSQTVTYFVHPTKESFILSMCVCVCVQGMSASLPATSETDSIPIVTLIRTECWDQNVSVPAGGRVCDDQTCDASFAEETLIKELSRKKHH